MSISGIAPVANTSLTNSTYSLAASQPSASNSQVSAFEESLQTTSTASSSDSSASGTSSSSTSGTSSSSTTWQAFDKAMINAIETMGIQQLSQFRENLQQAYET